MKKEIADMWVKALRSGEYLQAKGKLNINNTHFCCLGVLCELAVKNGVEIYKDSHIDDAEYINCYNGCETYLPEKVMEWGDMGSGEGIVFIDKNHKPTPFKVENRLYDLVSLNDAGTSFDRIAEIIETYWEKI